MTMAIHHWAKIIFAIIVVSWLSCARDASAQSAADVQNARELFRDALELSKQKKWAEAIALYQRSLALKEAPITLYSLGVAYKEVGRHAEALESLRQFLAKPSGAGTREFEAPARAAVAELEPKVGHITIAVDPADVEGLTVQVNERDMPLAGLGLPRLVNPGSHTIVARAPGHHDASATIDIAARESKEVALSLERAPEPVGEAADAPTIVVQGSPFPVIPVVLMSVGVAALATGITVGLLGVADADEAPTQDGEDADAARTKMLVGDIVAGAGGAIAAAGLIWLLIDVLSDDASSDELAITPQGLRIRF